MAALERYTGNPQIQALLGAAMERQRGKQLSKPVSVQAKRLEGKLEKQKARMLRLDKEDEADKQQLQLLQKRIHDRANERQLAEQLSLNLQSQLDGLVAEAKAGPGTAVAGACVGEAAGYPGSNCGPGNA